MSAVRWLPDRDCLLGRWLDAPDEVGAGRHELLEQRERIEPRDDGRPVAAEEFADLGRGAPMGLEEGDDVLGQGPETGPSVVGESHHCARRSVGLCPTATMSSRRSRATIRLTVRRFIPLTCAR